MIKRPGYGIPPKMLEAIIGRKAQKDIEKEDIITWDMI
ncbi:MAG: SAF domain-containing protein [Candidatus Hodarchaeota archaeon]